MRRDSRLSGVLHVLLHMAEQGTPMTSDQLAKAMRTNPVVVRRTMGPLRDAGLVAAERGHGGGWAIAAPLASITMRDIYEALGSPEPFAMGHRSESPGCRVERVVNAALADAFRDAEQLLLARLGAVTLEQLARDFHRRAKQHGDPYEHAM